MSEIDNSNESEKVHMLEELRIKEKIIEENLEKVSKYQHYGPCLKCYGWGKNLCNSMAYCKRCFNILRKVNPNFLNELEAHIKENQQQIQSDNQETLSKAQQLKLKQKEALANVIKEQLGKDKQRDKYQEKDKYSQKSHKDRQYNNKSDRYYEDDRHKTHKYDKRDHKSSQPYKKHKYD